MAAHTGYGLPFTILLCFISLFFNTKNPAFTDAGFFVRLVLNIHGGALCGLENISDYCPFRPILSRHRSMLAYDRK